MGDEQLTLFDCSPQETPPAPYAGQRDTAAEIRRQASHKQQILKLLSQEPTTSTVLKEITHRFGGRIHDLRHDDGHNILCEQDKATGVSTYTLIISEPPEDTP